MSGDFSTLKTRAGAPFNPRLMFGIPHLQRADCMVQSLDGGTQYIAVRVALEKQSPGRT